MKTKLILTKDQPVIENAKKYAKGKGQSLSDLVENYLKVVTREKDIPAIQLTPIVKSLKDHSKTRAAPITRKRLLNNYRKNIQGDRVLIDMDICEISVLSPENFLIARA